MKHLQITFFLFEDFSLKPFWFSKKNSGTFFYFFKMEKKNIESVLISLPPGAVSSGVLPDSMNAGYRAGFGSKASPQPDTEKEGAEDEPQGAGAMPHSRRRSGRGTAERRRSPFARSHLEKLPPPTRSRPTHDRSVTRGRPARRKRPQLPSVRGAEQSRAPRQAGLPRPPARPSARKRPFS